MSGSFVTVKCSECGNEQVVFDRPGQDVQCVVCDEVVAESRGGEAAFTARVVDTVS